MSDSLQPHGLLLTRLLCPEILQTRLLVGVAISFSRGSSQPRDQNLGLLYCRQILYHHPYRMMPKFLQSTLLIKPELLPSAKLCLSVEI